MRGLTRLKKNILGEIRSVEVNWSVLELDISTEIAFSLTKMY